MSNSSNKSIKIAKYEEINRKSPHNILKVESQCSDMKIDKNITIVNNFSNKQTPQQGKIGYLFWQIEALNNQNLQKHLIMQNMKLLMINIIFSYSINKNLYFIILFINFFKLKLKI